MKNNKLSLTFLSVVFALSLLVNIAFTEHQVAANTIDYSLYERTFEDLPSTHPSFEIIIEMYNLGYISGYPNGTFRPTENISRNHVAALLARVLPLEPVRAAKEFKDVPKKNPYYESIQRVQRAGIMTGDQNGNFNPTASLTRAQIAKIIDLAFGLNVKSNQNFRDISPTYWAKEHVMAVSSNEVINSDGEYFKPNDKVTRAEYATFLHRALKIENKNQAIPYIDMRGGGYGIENVEALYSFKENQLKQVKVMATDEHIYLLTRADAMIYLEKYSVQNELLEKATCEELVFWYEPYSYATDRVQLQGCSSGKIFMIWAR